MSRLPRVLVISSCSDTKTQPPAARGKRAQQIKKQLGGYTKELQKRVDKGGDVDEVQAKIDDLRSQLGEFMLLQEDFDPPRRAMRELQLADYRAPAAEMYAGGHHREVMKGITLLRETYGKDCVDLKIISAAYGLIDEDTEVLPYDVTFAGLDGHTLDGKAAALGIHDAVEQAIAPYDLVIFLLGQEYLRSVRLPVSYDRDRQRLIFVASSSGKEFLDYDENYGRVFVGGQESTAFGAAAVSLKGKVFHLLSQVVAKQGWNLMDRIKGEPQQLLTLLKPLRKPKVRQATLMETPMPALNSSFPMSYFMPENEDRVAEGYDPWILESKARKTGNTHLTDRYAHEILGSSPWDGILISLHAISKWPKKRQEDIFRLGAREYLRYSKDDGLLLGDCGAFTFDKKGQPPFTNRQVLERYRALGIDMGVSVDYLIFPELWKQNEVEAQRRFEKNLDSAQEFWNTWTEMVKESPWEFIPVGVAQGGTPEKLADAVKRLQQMGYRYIAIGGLAKSLAPVIEKSLQAIAPELLLDTQVHLFGFGKLEHAKYYRDLGVTAFDSTSSLRQAFTRAIYWDPEHLGRSWAAIRVPATGGRKASEMAQGEQPRDLKTSRRLEAEALASLRRYDETGSQVDFTAAKDALKRYDLFLKPWPYNPHMLDSIDTLKERPWKRCGCTICKDWGIAVVILRSNNHNRRRGFHNTWLFYQEKRRSVGPGLTHQQFVDMLSPYRLEVQLK